MLRQKLHQIRRYRHFVAVLGKYGFQEAAEIVRRHFPLPLLHWFGRRGTKKGVRHHSRPKRVRLALEEMGPMFIKLGQLLSTRPDLIPLEYIAELEHLQDQVPPVPGKMIAEELEREMGGKLENFFADFSLEPLAAGSIAQVHRARLFNGREVAVKVRRPNIVVTLQAELNILRDLTGLLRLLIMDEDDLNVQEMVSEFSQAILYESDLEHERKNIVRFQRNFKDTSYVHIPQVHRELCTKGALVMEYVDGVRPGRPETLRQAGLDPVTVSRNGAEFALSQIFVHGLFHTDPHPGNLLILPDNVIAPLDFGQVARLGSGDLKLLNEIMVAIVENDAATMLRALDRHNMMGEKTDEKKLHNQVESMFANYSGLPLAEIPFNEMIHDIFDLIRHNHIKPPRQFTLMLKSMLTLENLASNLDPEFNVVDHMQPYAQRYQMRNFDPRAMARNLHKVALDTGSLVARLPDDMQRLINKFHAGKLQMRVHHEHLDELSETLNRSSSRVSFALIIAALLVSSSMLVPQEGMVFGLATYQQLGMIGYISAAIIGVGLLVSMIRGRHV